MPNFGLVVNSTYNPMSFEQYAAPFEKYAQVYGQMADAFDTLEMEANKWEKLASSSQDQTQYEQYKKYAKDLKAAANDLAENGLSTKTRGLVSSLRGRYASEIQPIEEAYNLREKERELQRQALLQNPDIMFSRDASNTGLSAYMNGTPALQTYNGARLYEYTSKAVEQLAQAAREDLMENGANSEWYQILNGQYYQKDNYKGVTADVIMQSMFDANGKIRPEANKYLNAIANSAIELSGMRNWSNWNDVASRAYSYVNQGLWGAIGTEEEKQLSNKYWDYLMKKKETEESQKSYNLPPYERRSIYLAEHSSVAAKDALNSIAEKDSEGRYKIKDSNKSYMISTPKYYSAGPNAVKTVTQETTPSGSYNTIMEIYNTFHPESPITEGNIQQKINDGTIEDFINSNEYQSYVNQTASKHSEFIRRFESGYGEDFKTIILESLGDATLQEMQFGKNNDGSYGYKAMNELKSSELADSKYKVVGLTYGMYGFNVRISDGSSVKSYKLPASVNEDLQTMMGATIHGVPINGQLSGGIAQIEEKSAQLQAAYEQALANDVDSSTLAYIQAEIIRNEQLLKTLYSTLHMQASQLGIVSSTKTNESPVYGPTL